MYARFSWNYQVHTVFYPEYISCFIVIWRIAPFADLFALHERSQQYGRFSCLILCSDSTYSGNKKSVEKSERFVRKTRFIKIKLHIDSTAYSTAIKKVICSMGLGLLLSIWRNHRIICFDSNYKRQAYTKLIQFVIWTSSLKGCHQDYRQVTIGQRKFGKSISWSWNNETIGSPPHYSTISGMK